MRSRHRFLRRLALAAALLLGPAAAAAFPDIPFCPLGGPPGWIDRLTDDDDHRYPPPYYPPPPLLPYGAAGYPGVYVPPYPIYPPYLRQ